MMKEISFLELQNRLQNIEDDFLAIDVRSAGEWNMFSLPEDKRIVYIETENIHNEYMKFPKDKDIIVYCASGYRSTIVSHFLDEKGFQVINVYDGIL